MNEIDGRPPTLQETPTGDRLAETDPGGYRRVSGGERLVGSWIGAFELEELLGEGGMGAVYLARQHEPLERRVALKLIRTNLSHPDLRRRFEVERQVLARLNHPHIAQVFEAGDTAEGSPYLAMELVEGEELTRYCDRKQLDLPARLELMVLLCRAIQYAHQKGVIHRDLKPDNILVAEVDGVPVPKIIDFGIAKPLTEVSGVEEGLTAHGSILGTPAYLSPEYVRGLGREVSDIDTRTDVYALGVVAFELLAGVRPFGRPTDSLLDVLREITEGEVRPPSVVVAAQEQGAIERWAQRRGTTASGLVRSLRGDLDAIVLKAMARDRDGRYGSAAELAADIERHCRDEPVIATPPSRLYRAGKALKRHRAAVIAAGLVALSLVGGLVARTAEARRAEQARAEAEQVVDFLLHLFEVSDPNQSRGEEITAREVLDRGAAELSQKLDQQPLVRARMMDAIGRVYEGLGLWDDAGPLLEEALRLQREDADAKPARVAETLVHLASVECNEGRFELCEEHLEEALALRRKHLGPDDPTVASSLDEIGFWANVQGDWKKSEPLLLQALEIRERHFGPNHPDVAATLDHLAVLHFDQGQLEAAEPLYARALQIRRDTLGSDHPQTLTSLMGLGITRARLGRWEEAESIFREVLAERERILGMDHPEVAQVLNNLANVVIENGDLEEAQALLERSAAIWEKTGGPEHPRLGIVLFNLGDVQLQRGNLEAARSILERSAEVFEAAYGEDHPLIAYSWHSLGEVHQAEGRWVEAEASFRKALALREVRFEAGNEELESTREALAGLLDQRGRSAEAATIRAGKAESSNRGVENEE